LSSNFSETEENGAVGGAAKTAKQSNIPHYKPNDSKKQISLKLESTSSKFSGKRPAKGSDDPIRTYNKFGSLDNMELEGTTSPKPKRK